MTIICDTHILLFWADAPQRLSKPAQQTLELGIEQASLACSDISLWEIAMLYARGRINNLAGVSSSAYLQDIVTAMNLSVLPITPQIAERSQTAEFVHGDPADRIIAATALTLHAPLITADEKLQLVPGLRWVW